jgi:hypothetical protein
VSVKKARLDEDQEGESSLLEDTHMESMIDPALLEPTAVDDSMQLDLPNGVSEEHIETDTAVVVEDYNDTIGLSSGNENMELEDSIATISNAVKEEPGLIEVTTKTLTGELEESAGSPRLKKENSLAWHSNQATGAQRASMSPAQRHSSRQPKQIERYVPAIHKSPTKSQPKPTRSERRASSAASGQTMVDSVESRRSSSNTSGTTHRMAGTTKEASQEVSGPRASRGSTVESEPDADEKLARELQAEEHGLRRRASMKM